MQEYFPFIVYPLLQVVHTAFFCALQFLTGLAEHDALSFPKVYRGEQVVHFPPLCFAQSAIGLCALFANPKGSLKVAYHQ